MMLVEVTAAFIPLMISEFDCCIRFAKYVRIFATGLQEKLFLVLIKRFRKNRRFGRIDTEAVSDRRLILIPGQVEDDASIKKFRFNSNEILLLECAGLAP